jgi:hypothetical protein
LPPELSARVTSHVEQLFPADERGAAASVLADECGEDLPLIGDANQGEIERVRVAALKLSGGDLAKLRHAVAIAQRDWRDVLVAAGFGSDPVAHERWRPGAE